MGGTANEGFRLLQDSPGSSSGSEHYLTAEDTLSSPNSTGTDDFINLGQDLIEMFKYVDHTTTVETVPAGLAIRHISSGQPTEQVPAQHTGSFFSKVNVRAGEIGMVINCKKTQLVCISPDNGYSSWASFDSQGGEIKSQDSMKLLGFVLGSAPGVSHHVAHLRRKFRVRFWSIIHLKRAGISGMRLFRLYAALVWPVIEANSMVYHSMLTGQHSDILE